MCQLKKMPAFLLSKKMAAFLATYLSNRERESYLTCREIIKEVFSSQLDLKDELLPNSDMTRFTDGN